MNNERRKDIEFAFNESQKQLDMALRKLDKNNMEKPMTENNESYLKEAKAKINEKIRELEGSKVRIAIIGRSGQGKSSLINEIAGSKVSNVGVAQTTFEPIPYTKGGLTFIDYPGCGPTKFPTEEYIKKMNLLNDDIFIILTSGRFFSDDVDVYQELVKHGKSTIFLVRSKFDQDVADGRYNHPPITDVNFLKNIIIKNSNEDFSTDCPKIYFVSTRGERYDYPELMDDITKSLSGVKSDRFVREARAWSKSAIKKKDGIADKLIASYSAAAALNGINPIPGMDVAVDLSIMFTMAKHLQHLWGLDEADVDYLTHGKYAMLKEMQNRIERVLAIYLTTEGAMQFLKKYATREVAKHMLKWIPFVGQVIAAGIGYKLTTLFGEEVNSQFKAIAEEFVENVIIEKMDKAS